MALIRVAADSDVREVLSGFLQRARAAEHALPDAHRRHVAHAGASGCRGARRELLAHRAQLRSAQDRLRVHLARRRRDQHVVGSLERVPAGERLAEGRLRERHHAADALCVRRRAHRELAVEREGLGPAQRLQTQRARLALDLRAEHVGLPRAAKRREALRAGQLACLHRLPLERAAQLLQNPLGREVRDRACEIEVEGAIHRLQGA